MIHQDGTTSTMCGQARDERAFDGSKTMLRYYRCAAARKDTGPATCDGFGTVSGGQPTTAVSADVIDATVILWALNLAEDPDRLHRYAQEADRQLLSQQGDSEDLNVAHRALARLESKKARYLDAYADDLMTREQLGDRIKKLDGRAGTLRATIERATAVEEQRETLTASLDDLLSMPIEEAPDGWRDPAADEPNPERDRYELRRAAMATLSKPDRWGRTPRLSAWAIAEAERYVTTFGAEVILSHPGEGKDPRRPKVQVNFSPLAPIANSALQQDGQSQEKL